MAIQNDKLMNLADGKVLYDDLRERVEGKYTKPSGGIPASDLAAGVIPDISGKLDKPTTAGTQGQVLTADGQGGQSWEDPQGGGGTVTDVQVNGTSVVTDGVADIPIANAYTPGVIKVGTMSLGLSLNSDGRIFIERANDYLIKTGGTNDNRRTIDPYVQHISTFYGLAKAAGSDEKNSTLPVGQYTESAKSAISTMLNAPVSVTGTTPSITALAGVRYVCGEVSTLDITLPASGCIDVVFESGSTATVLTITPPTGVTVKWANGFDPTSLDANTTYEINIMDGLGVAVSWT